MTEELEKFLRRIGSNLATSALNEDALQKIRKKEDAVTSKRMPSVSVWAIPVEQKVSCIVRLGDFVFVNDFVWALLSLPQIRFL